MEHKRYIRNESARKYMNVGQGIEIPLTHKLQTCATADPPRPLLLRFFTGTARFVVSATRFGVSGIRLDHGYC